MKRPILIFAAVFSLLSMQAQELQVDSAESLSPRAMRVARRLERHRLDGRENNFFLSVSSGMTRYNQLLAIYKLEYSRQITGHLYWGAAFSMNRHQGEYICYDWSGAGLSPYCNTVDQDIYKLDGMIYYRLSVIASRLFFRLGTGVGLGYHRVRAINDDGIARNKLLPYVNVEASWILRVSRSVELKFSPMVFFSPSEFSISPSRIGQPTDVRPWILDVGMSLGVGYRF